ncbi:MAG: hypothetical protein WC796_04530 [Candidatus Pacearchaeota archaeon]|jgi:predicted metal-binding transcription factor (methanogenesis marker protein 9)
MPCFKSLVYCCNFAEPCSGRDRELERRGLTREGYESLKRFFDLELARLLRRKKGRSAPVICGINREQGYTFRCRQSKGSLAYCCPIQGPDGHAYKDCSLRDRELERLGLTLEEYVSLKRQFAEIFP